MVVVDGERSLELDEGGGCEGGGKGGWDGMDGWMDDRMQRWRRNDQTRPKAKKKKPKPGPKLDTKNRLGWA